MDKLGGIEIKRVYCGSQFSVALSSDGEVFSWGRGDDFRLGHGTEDHVRYPKRVDGLYGKIIKQLAVSQFFCLALTQNSEIYGWGRNEGGCMGDVAGTFLPLPTLIHPLKGRSIVGMAAGPSQVRSEHPPYTLIKRLVHCYEIIRLSYGLRIVDGTWRNKFRS